MPLISIIVPIYNTEKYLHRCINSIISQTYTDFECILIDDGSTDNSSKICDEFAKKDPRFKLFRQENKGRAKARDRGIKSSVCSFLTFVDSDDWLEPNALQLLVNRQKVSDADIVIGNFRIILKYGVDESCVYPNPEKFSNPLVYFLLAQCNSLYAKLYRTELFDNLLIQDTQIGEDAIMNVQIFSGIKPDKLQSIDSIIYNYDRRTEGITTRRQFDYASFSDNPNISCRLWIENYLYETKQNEAVLDAFTYYILTEIIPHLKFNKILEKKEIGKIYGNYYKNSHYINLLRIEDRYIIPIFNQSILIGRLYGIFSFFFRRIIKLIRILAKNGNHWNNNI